MFCLFACLIAVLFSSACVWLIIFLVCLIVCSSACILFFFGRLLVFCCFVCVQASSEALSARQEAARARVSANSAQAGMMKQLNDQVGMARGEKDVPLFIFAVALCMQRL